MSVSCVLSLYVSIILILLHVEFSAILAIFKLIEERHPIIVEMVQTIEDAVILQWKV